MTDKTRQAIVPYAAAVGLTAFAIGVRWMLHPLLGDRLSLVTLYAAVAASAWLGGYRPALLATMLGYMAASFLFIFPQNVPVAAQIIGGLTYFVSCGMIIGFGEAVRSARRRSESDRARLDREAAERQAADAARRSSEERFHRLIQSELIGIAFFHADGRITDANNAYLKLIGYSRDELLAGKVRWDVLTPKEWLPVARKRIEEFRYTGRIPQYEQEHFRKDGSRFWALIGGVALGGVDEGIAFVLDITERKLAEEASRQAREQLQLVADTMPAFVARCSRDGRFVWTNKRYAQQFGYTPEQLAGRSIVEIIGRDTYATIEPYTQKALAGETVEYEAQINFPGVGGKWVHVAYAPTYDVAGMPDGWVAIITNIDRRKELENALRQSEQRFRLIAEMVPSIVWMAASDGTITYANRHWYDYCGISPEVNARDWPVVLHPDDRERCMAEWGRAIAEGREYEIEVRNRRHDGVYRWFVTRAVPHRGPDGRIISWFGVTIDIHDQKEMNEQLREADRRKDEFLATLAHELRNPLAPIRNAARILGLAGSMDETATHARDIIDRQVGQMTRLVDDLMDVSRITRGRVQLQRRPVDLSVVIRDAVETTNPSMSAAGHELSIELPSEPVYVNGDPVRLAQVFANLLHNAVKYTEPGGKIRLSVEPSANEVAVRVRDNGIGIAPEYLPRVFEMFSQVTPALERSQGGLGIGLALVKGLIDLHGGRVEVQSDGLGLGSEFIVRLPVVSKIDSNRNQGADPLKTTVPPAQQTPRLVLVVDDNRDAVDTLSAVLRWHGHDIHCAFNGSEALEIAAVIRPEAVFMDIGMPGVNGYEVARQIRQQDWGRSVLLVATTGWGQEDDKRRALEAGFDHHLTKPVDPSVLVAMLA